jgi:hypothetical protein
MVLAVGILKKEKPCVDLMTQPDSDRPLAKKVQINPPRTNSRPRCPVTWNRDSTGQSAKEIRAFDKFSGISKEVADGWKIGLTNAAVRLY